MVGGEKYWLRDGRSSKKVEQGHVRILFPLLG